MLDLIQITHDPEMARRCDRMPGMRLFVDLERDGKAERQAGRNTFISTHTLEDVGRVRSVLQRARLMVRVNPLNPGTASEVDAVLAQGADWLMLPMFTRTDEVRDFCALVNGRARVTVLLETADAYETLPMWMGTPGLHEVFVGLNDLHLSLGLRFMFEPLALGLLDGASRLVRAQGLRFGFGGIARLDEGLLPGRDVLAEHLRLGSQAVILSRTFHRPEATTRLEDEVAALRQAERELALRDPGQMDADRQRIAYVIGRIAMAQRSPLAQAT
ncbi:MAG: aldolase/citrate lyase family protein [Hydrogenophaga sp.]|nr:aldolase/citrate lyase family protein [Hydrogenophaga sp.]